MRVGESIICARVLKKITIRGVHVLHSFLTCSRRHGTRRAWSWSSGRRKRTRSSDSCLASHMTLFCDENERLILFVN